MTTHTYRVQTADGISLDVDAATADEAMDLAKFAGHIPVTARPAPQWAPMSWPEAEKPSAAAALLREAAEIIDGAREAQHGDKERSFAGIAARWSDWLGKSVSPFDVAVMMALLKLERWRHGQRLRDHLLDAAGYLGIAWELEEKMAGSEKPPAE